jgi:hypothetical protein
MAVVLPVEPTSGKPKKLLDQVCDVMRLKHYSLRTERTYCDWIERFISVPLSVAFVRNGRRRGERVMRRVI